MKLTACLQAGLLALLGDRPNSERVGSASYVVRTQICLTYFKFCTKYLGLAGAPGWQPSGMIQFVVHQNFRGDKLLSGPPSDRRDLRTWHLSVGFVERHTSYRRLCCVDTTVKLNAGWDKMFGTDAKCSNKDQNKTFPSVLDAHFGQSDMKIEP